MAVPDTLCGWGDKQKAAYFLENAEIIIPRRRDQLATLLGLFTAPADAELAVIDLGAGFGAVAQEILARYPRAIVTCVDGSTEMMALARERLASHGARVRFCLADLADASWRNGLDAPFDAAVSALAIHHLTNDRKRALYREVFDLLRPGGLFFNNDLVASPPALRDRFEALTLQNIQDQERAARGTARTLEQIQAEMRRQLQMAGERHQSHIAPMRDQLQWLFDAGFKSVDCCWKYLDIAIFGGVKE